LLFSGSHGQAHLLRHALHWIVSQAHSAPNAGASPCNDCNQIATKLCASFLENRSIMSAITRQQALNSF
jgi:hypothetical protein